MLTELLGVARELDVDLVGNPRLVRLNPNIPWKTRGNAALAARFGRGCGRRKSVGELAGRRLWAYRSGSPLPKQRFDSFAERAWQVVRAAARTDGPATDPALVVTSHQLPPSLYWQAVRSIVTPEQAERVLAEHDARRFWERSKQGLIGAAAAIAWPGRRVTWELLAYRYPHRIGTPRWVDPKSVRAAQRQWQELFLCFDPRTRRLLVAPHTPCPILYGLRATRPDRLPAARRGVRSEPVERWVIFRTNQGTGDHLLSRSIGELRAFDSAILEGAVTTPPVTLPGGHVRFAIRDATRESIDCLVFEPTKTLPSVARSLFPGDRVRVWGGRKEDPAFRVEGIELLFVNVRRRGRRPPVCPVCGHRTRSLGWVRGFRCFRCRIRVPPESALLGTGVSVLTRGVFHPTPSARRHLAPRGPEPGRDTA